MTVLRDSATTGSSVTEWLGPFGLTVDVSDRRRACPHLGWAASGGMHLSGLSGLAPVLAPGPVVPLLLDALGVLGKVTAELGARVSLDPSLVIGARAGSSSSTRRGAVSVGGTTRLLPALDGWCAVSLAREDDRGAVPAICQEPGGPDPWRQLAGAVRRSHAAAICERIRLFGIPAAVIGEVEPGATPVAVTRIASPRVGDLRGALVVDFSSLWAGPLCAKLLGAAGATVVKVESLTRPDGARVGNRPFYDWLHAGQRSIAVDFSDHGARARLAELVSGADVVIEASRPRALEQLGLAHHQVALKPGVVWVSITGHGRRRPDLVAFGDDAAAAGGLVGVTPAGPVFCGDAIADPLTGVVAAVGAAAGLRTGGGVLVDVSMAATAAGFARAPLGCPGEHVVRREAGDWFLACSADNRDQRVLPARRPRPVGRASASGADNDWFRAAVR